MSICSSKVSIGAVSIKALILAAALPSFSAALPTHGPKAWTEYGAISGVHENGMSVYKGVPFAAPPTGDLRWRAPARVVPGRACVGRMRLLRRACKRGFRCRARLLLQ